MMRIKVKMHTPNYINKHNSNQTKALSHPIDFPDDDLAFVHFTNKRNTLNHNSKLNGNIESHIIHTKSVYSNKY